MTRKSSREYWHNLTIEEQQYKSFRSRLYRYGITVEQWYTLWEKQGECCAACGTKELRGGRNWHIDHIKNTKIIRGILCPHCNVALGQLDNSIERIEMLLAYMKMHQLSIVERS